jgi:oligogalacturonide transport system permease protein
MSAIMIYPLLWLFGASFKSNSEIFSSIWFMPDSFDFTAYKNGWKTSTPYTMGHFFLNTFSIVISKTILAVVSSVIVSYGFARFDFPLKKFFFVLLNAAMFMPVAVTIPPMINIWQYAFGINFMDTYVPLILPSAFACEGTFVLILIQFFRNVPKELDESARIDGCGTLRLLVSVLVPCIKPAIISIAVFNFLWTMNDFFSPLIYIHSIKKYTLSLALRLSVDNTGQGYEQNKIIAMSLIGLIPSVSVFALVQKKFVSGITAGGLSQ